MKKLLILFLGLMVAGCTATTPPAPTQTAVPTQAATDTAVKSVTPAETAPTEYVEQNLDHADILDQLLFTAGSRDASLQLLQQIEESGDTQFVAPLIDTIRYQRGL